VSSIKLFRYAKIITHYSISLQHPIVVLTSLYPDFQYFKHFSFTTTIC